MLSPSECERRIRGVLTPDLLSPKYSKRASTGNPLWGHCYAATEAAWHLLEDANWVPQVARDEDITHWWLKHRVTGEILDITAEQYTLRGTTPPHNEGRGCGFLTKQPSKRAREIISRVQGQ